METKFQKNNGTKKLSLHFEWIIPTILKPHDTIHTIIAEEKRVWLTPLVLLSGLGVLFTLVAAPIRKMVIQSGLNTPLDFQYYSADQQTQFLNAQATQTSPLFLYLFPILSGLAAIWISWFILSSILHLSLTLSGSRSASTCSFNLVAWSMIPLALRYVMQIIVMLISRSTISAQGLSGFVSLDATGFAAYFGALLGLIDVYFIWQIVLLMIGVIPISNLKKTKAWLATSISLVVLALLQALPGFLGSILGGLSLTRLFFF
jgi:hypothetical protein